MKNYLLDNGRVTISDLSFLKDKTIKIEVSEDTVQKIKNCRDFLDKKIEASEKPIYGINTGFGPMAQYKIEETKRVQLQYNLIRSHCSGMGAPLDISCIRAAMLSQLNTLMLAKSGVTPDIVLLIQQLLNQEVYPIVFDYPFLLLYS